MWFRIFLFLLVSMTVSLDAMFVKDVCHSEEVFKSTSLFYSTVVASQISRDFDDVKVKFRSIQNAIREGDIGYLESVMEPVLYSSLYYPSHHFRIFVRECLMLGSSTKLARHFIQMHRERESFMDKIFEPIWGHYDFETFWILPILCNHAANNRISLLFEVFDFFLEFGAFTYKNVSSNSLETLKSQSMFSATLSSSFMAPLSWYSLASGSLRDRVLFVKGLGYSFRESPWEFEGGAFKLFRDVLITHSVTMKTQEHKDFFALALTVILWSSSGVKREYYIQTLFLGAVRNCNTLLLDYLLEILWHPYLSAAVSDLDNESLAKSLVHGSCPQTLEWLFLKNIKSNLHWVDHLTCKETFENVNFGLVNEIDETGYSILDSASGLLIHCLNDEFGFAEFMPLMRKPIIVDFCVRHSSLLSDRVRGWLDDAVLPIAEIDDMGLNDGQTIWFKTVNAFATQNLHQVLDLTVNHLFIVSSVLSLWLSYPNHILMGNLDFLLKFYASCCPEAQSMLLDRFINIIDDDDEDNDNVEGNLFMRILGHGSYLEMENLLKTIENVPVAKDYLLRSFKMIDLSFDNVNDDIGTNSLSRLALFRWLKIHYITFDFSLHVSVETLFLPVLLKHRDIFDFLDPRLLELLTQPEDFLHTPIPNLFWILKEMGNGSHDSRIDGSIGCCSTEISSKIMQMYPSLILQCSNSFNLDRFLIIAMYNKQYGSGVCRFAFESYMKSIYFTPNYKGFEAIAGSYFGHFWERKMMDKRQSFSRMIKWLVVYEQLSGFKTVFSLITGKLSHDIALKIFQQIFFLPTHEILGLSMGTSVCGDYRKSFDMACILRYMQLKK